MNFSEYRMCESKVNNLLRNVTLLEEAHYFLQRNNIDYADGDALIIADLSPSVVNLSIICNAKKFSSIRLLQGHRARIL